MEPSIIGEAVDALRAQRLGNDVELVFSIVGLLRLGGELSGMLPALSSTKAVPPGELRLLGCRIAVNPDQHTHVTVRRIRERC